jgi:hypothetical protein
MLLSSVLDGTEQSLSLSGHFMRRDMSSNIHWIGGWAGHRASLDNFREEKKSLAPAGNENCDSLLAQPIAL